MPITIVFPSQNTINSFPVAIYPDGRQVSLQTACDVAIHEIRERINTIPSNVISNQKH